jgi:TP901 family phage tail tape measure protein
MADKGSGPNYETVELQLVSRMPSRKDTEGIHHVLKGLAEIERRIGAINGMSISPRGMSRSATASETSALKAKADAIGSVNDQIEKQQRLQGALFKQTLTERNTRRGKFVTREDFFRGPGVVERFKFRVEPQNPYKPFNPNDPNAKFDVKKTTNDSVAAARESERSIKDFERTKRVENARRQREAIAEQKRRQDVRDQQQAQYDQLKKDAESRFGLQRTLSTARQQGSDDWSAEQDRRDRLRAQQQRIFNRAAKGTPLDPNPPPEKNPLSELQKRFSPRGLAEVGARLGAWAATSMAFWQTLQGIQYTLGRVIDVGLQTARLGQVFSGVGGSAKQLTDDIMRLASENGRATDEAMEAGIQWARLGLNRREINQAVKVSLMAANVAEMTAAESTKYLSSVMMAYGLHVEELGHVLGMLNQTSNTYNVTNRDLLEGLSRVAAVASQAGLSLGELQGILGAAVGRTGQTGANIGNALKSIIVAISNPEIQQFMRGNLGIEVGADSGGMKNLSQVLSEVFVWWQKATKEEKDNMTVRVAGKTQANRFVAIMENYVQAQKLAINAQENLNSAENENIRITGTMKSQLAGLRAEYDRFAVYAANKRSFAGLGVSPMEFGTEIIRTGKNALRAGREGSLNPMSLLPGGGGSLANALITLSTAGMMYWNQSQESPSERALETATGQSMRLGNLSDAARLRGGLLRSVSDTLGSEKGMRYAAQATSVLPKDAQAQYRAAIESGNQEQIRSILLANAVKADEKSVRLEKQRVDQLQIQARSLDDQIGKLEVLESSEKGLADADAKRLNELLRQRQVLDDVIKRKKVEEETGLQFDTRDVKRRAFFNTTDAMTGGIGDVFGLAGGATKTDALNLQIAAMQRQAQVVEERIKRANAPGSGISGSAEGNAAIAKENERLRELRAQIQSLGSPQSRSITGFYDQMRESTRSQARQVGGFGVGVNDTEKLLNTEKELVKLIEERTAAAKAAEQVGDKQGATQSYLLAVDAEAKLHDVINQKLDKRVELQTELKNLALEQKKAYAESMLMAGPGDLLRKLSVKSMVDRKGGKLDFADFMSMSPEARRDAMEYTGGFRTGSINSQLNSLNRKPKFTPDQLMTQAQRLMLEFPYNDDGSPVGRARYEHWSARSGAFAKAYGVDPRVLANNGRDSKYFKDFSEKITGSYAMNLNPQSIAGLGQALPEDVIMPSAQRMAEGFDRITALIETRVSGAFMQIVNAANQLNIGSGRPATAATANGQSAGSVTSN